MSVEPRRSFFVSGGTLPATSASYIERGTDAVLFDSLVEGRFCYVLNSRQLGKSSLSVHTITRLKEQGVRTSFVDLTRIGGQTATPEQWYSGVALEIACELNCRREAIEYWRANLDRTLVQRLFGFLGDVALTHDESPLVVFIDEIDATRSLPFDPDEFFAGIRECYNRRVSDPVFQRLTFCLIGVAVPSDLVRNSAMTPFNIGERITLEDFTLRELSAYAPHLGADGNKVVERVHYWTGGHPFLTQSLCRSITALERAPTADDVDEAVRRELFDYKARDSNINLADVANIALHYGGSDTERATVLSLYGRVLSGREVMDDESSRSVVILKLSGIVRTDGRRLKVRNRIYRKVFDRNWIEEHMPEQELRRQHQSFRRGVFRTAAIAGAVLAALTGVTIYALIARSQAQSAQEKLNYQLYVADMNSLRHFYDSGDTARIEAILNSHRSSPYRGFEWGYWLGRYHDTPEEYTLNYAAAGKRLEGHLSGDGKELCLCDLLTSTATVLDRASKKVMFTVRISPGDRVVPLQSRWVAVRAGIGDAFRVDDLRTGHTLLSLGTRSQPVFWFKTVEHSDLIAAGEGTGTRHTTVTIRLWNAATRKPIFSMPSRWRFETDVWTGLFSFSRDGRYVLSGGVSAKEGAATSAQAEAELLDRQTGKIVDQFPIGDAPVDFGGSLSGGRAFLLDQRGAFVRDFQRHTSSAWRPQLLPEWQVLAGAFSGDSLIVLVSGGRSLVQSLSGDHREILRDNVTTIAAGAKPGEYLAGSNTVRIYSPDTASTEGIVASGTRVTRFAPGILNLFGPGRIGIVRVDDRRFRTVGALRVAGDAGSYTYGGHWALARGSNGAPDRLEEAEGKSPPVSLPFSPTIWSVGRTGDSIALWDVHSRRLIGYSSIAKAPRWSLDYGGLNSLWVSPDGSRLFIEENDRDLTVVDMANGRKLALLKVHNAGPVYLTFSADGRKFFTCGGDGTTVMWDLATLQKLGVMRGNDQDGVTSADISPDGRRIVTSTRSGSWQLWDASNGVQLMDVHVSPASLSSTLFLPGGKEIVTAGEDDKVRIWKSVDSDPTAYLPIDPQYLADLHR